MKPWLIAIAASAGGITAIRRVLSTLPAARPAVVVILQRRLVS
jgi:chemotaxis response regulator CheB